jgi:hypothetical protein
MITKNHFGIFYFAHKDADHFERAKLIHTEQRHLNVIAGQIFKISKNTSDSVAMVGATGVYDYHKISSKGAFINRQVCYSLDNQNG